MSRTRGQLIPEGNYPKSQGERTVKRSSHDICVAAPPELICMSGNVLNGEH